MYSGKVSTVIDIPVSRFILMNGTVNEKDALILKKDSRNRNKVSIHLVSL